MRITTANRAKALWGERGADLPADAEIVANLWYVVDDQGLIYSLRAKVYVASGTDDQKLSLLLSRAYLDYLVARPFQLPERFWTAFIGANGCETKMPVIYHDAAVAMGGLDQLFFEALDRIASDLPAQTRLKIPESPLVNVTALFGAEGGAIVPMDALRP